MEYYYTIPIAILILIWAVWASTCAIDYIYQRKPWYWILPLVVPLAVGFIFFIHLAINEIIKTS